MTESGYNSDNSIIFDKPRIIHSSPNSEVKLTTYEGTLAIAKKIRNSRSGKHEILVHKSLEKCIPEYVLPILTAKESEKNLKIVLPKYGVSIFDFMVNRKQTLRLTELKFIYKHIATALMKIHEGSGQAHLDIKEENILVDPETLYPVLIDFATVRKRDAFSKKKLTNYLGSKGFMAPEIINKEFINDASKCDVYSFGCCLYSSFTGEYKPDKLDKRPKDIPEILWSVIKAATAKYPELRPSFRGILTKFQFFL